MSPYIARWILLVVFTGLAFFFGHMASLDCWDWVAFWLGGKSRLTLVSQLDATSFYIIKYVYVNKQLCYVMKLWFIF